MAHPRMYRDDDPYLDDVRKVCLALPEATEVEAWGRPTFHAGKIFALFTGVEEERYSIVFKPESDERAALLEDPRFYVPPYWGPGGWLGLDLTAAPVDWDEVAELVESSYRQVALKRMLKELDAALTDTLHGYEVVAFNTAVESDNKIHDDAVARRFGFEGGLVPGVDVYAYLTHPPAEAWGLDWLARGSMQARFAKPVYEGVRVVVEPVEQRDRWARLELRDADGELSATAVAALPEDPPEPEDVSWPEVEQVDAVTRPPASPSSLPVGTVFGLEAHGFHADRAGEYLDAVREPLPLYREANVAHPGWLLRDANYVLARNVRLGPWIHVESSARHHRLVPDGQSVVTRARVVREWEHKGHRFVTLDVGVLADGELAVHVEHTAIYAPRQLSSATM